MDKNLQDIHRAKIELLRKVLIVIGAICFLILVCLVALQSFAPASTEVIATLLKLEVFLIFVFLAAQFVIGWYIIYNENTGVKK